MTTTTTDAEPAGRLQTSAEAGAAFARRIPVSLALALILIATAIISGTILGGPSPTTLETWAAGVRTTFDAGAWWTIASALIIPWDPFQLVAGVLAAVLLLGVAERRMGAWRTVLAFAVTGALGVLLGTTLQWAGSLLGEWWATGTAEDLTLDPLTGIVGALVTSTAFMGALWRRRIRIVTLAFVLVFVLYDGDPSNVYRCFAILVALPLGAVLARDASTLRARRSSHGETRTLVAAVVAVTAFGPIVSFATRSTLTPFAFASYLFADEPIEFDTVTAQCGAEPSGEECLRELAILSSQGPGMFVLSFVPVLLLLLAAWGLRMGRRFAWWLAIGVNAAILLFAKSSFDVSITVGDELDPADWSAFDIGELLIWGVAAALLPIGIIVMLIVTRRDFRLRTDALAFRRFWLTVGGTFVVLAAAYFVIGFATLAEYWPSAAPADLLVDTLKRFVPPHFLAATDPIVLPGHDLTSIAAQWVGPVFWAVFIIAAVRLLMTSRARGTNAADDDRLRVLLRRHGGGTLGFMTTWPGNTPWFTADGEGAVAYRVINGVAITMSDPICAPDRAAETIREFAAFCDANGWTPVFYSTHPQYLPVFEEMGWQHMSVGEETIVRTTGLELTGKPWQKVRQALNRGIKEGMTTVWTSWRDLPLATAAEITAISEEWVAEKELPEMGFTLGGMEELKDDEVRLMLAVAPDGRLQAVTSWLPVYRDGAVVGWTIDFMRRADGSMNGIMEFLIASAALHMKDTGAEVLSLSGAPLATKPLEAGEEPPAPTPMTRLLEWLAQTLEPAYGFSSLFRFKAKFNPEYETISMAYPDPLALPAIGIAVGKAYLPEVSPAEAVALVRTLTRAD